MSNKLISFLQLYRSIPEQEQLLITTAFELKNFKEGDELFEGDRICQQLFFVCDGVLRIVRLNEKGNELVHHFSKENMFCTILNSFNNQVPVPERIQAACDAEVFQISRAGLFSLYEELPYLKELIDHISQQALIRKVEIRNAYMGMDSTERYLHFLHLQPEIALRVSLTDIASYLGITPQSLSRIRKNIR